MRRTLCWKIRVGGNTFCSHSINNDLFHLDGCEGFHSDVSMKNDLSCENTFSLAELSIDGTIK